MAARSKQKSQSNQHQVQQLKEKLARALADYQNLEKRFRQESTEIIKFSNRQLLTKLLDFKDNLERAASVIQDKGLDLVLEQLNQLLTQEHVQEISALNQPFDPNLMEAEEVVEGEKDKVIAVVRKGYLLHGRLLRPAKVKVGSGYQKTKNKSLAESDN